jgi:hypothetical protein
MPRVAERFYPNGTRFAANGQNALTRIAMTPPP